jgi:hypothetical protein
MIKRLHLFVSFVSSRINWRDRVGEAGMTTAELLGNAALGIAALVAIWAVLQTLGLDIIDWIRGQLRV